MANDNYSNVFILCQEGSTLPECKDLTAVEPAVP